MDYRSGLCLLSFLHVVFNAHNTFYTVHLEKYSFEEAQRSCKTDGFLTNMANQEETSKILKAIENKGDKRQNHSLTFWIGLKKNRILCVHTNLPLKGFSWIVETTDISTEFLDYKWYSEPPATCTAVLCGLLTVKYGSSSVDSWHLASSSCKQTYPFICRHEGQSDKKPCPDPIITGSRDIMQKMNDPYTLHVTCDGMDTFTLICSKSTHEWTLVGSTVTDIAQLCQGCQTGYKKDLNGNCVDINECEQPNTCKDGCINTIGSYVCKCPDGMEQDSENCKKAETLSPSSHGQHFHDQPTPPSMEERHPPSPHPDSTTVSIEEVAGDLSNIIIPVIIALLIFVVLVVITVGIVKCCLIRRSKKQAKKRAEASKESMALNGADSMERVNEKVAT